MIKIVHNKLLGGWYVVRGPHHFPLAGPVRHPRRGQGLAGAQAMKPEIIPVE